MIRPTRLTIDVDAAPTSTADVYLRLHLLSHRLTPPNSVNLDGVFALLNTVAWTDIGPIAVADVADVVLARRAAGGALTVKALDKFPPCSTMSYRAVCASPTAVGFASAPTSPRARR